MWDKVEREITLTAPPAVVWAALTAPRQLGQWFAASVDLELRPGGWAEFRWESGATRRAVIEEVLAPSRLSFRWLPFERLAGGSVRRRASTRVEITVEEAEGGTLLRVVERALLPHAVAGPALSFLSPASA